jgi:putative drug exporter of the RND superfamily
VALDALVVRLVLIPALLAVTRYAAWYKPRWLARVLPKVWFSREAVKAEKRSVHSDQIHYPERT